MEGKADPLSVFRSTDSLHDAKTKAWNDTAMALKSIQILLGSTEEVLQFMVHALKKLYPFYLSFYCVSRKLAKEN